jgi:nucleoside-diphosphate-sugar epimerase
LFVLSSNDSSRNRESEAGVRVILTGSSGYIGRLLAPRLAAKGHSVIGIDREQSASAQLADFIHCDLLDTNGYAHALQPGDHICHLAAAKGDWGISKQEFQRDNVEATRALLGAARAAGVKRWIFYSTVSALGPSAVPLDESAPRRPANPYGSSKADCEEIFDRYAAEEPSAHVVTIRPSVVFGPENPWNTNIYRLIDAIDRKRFVMVGRGAEVKSTSYIDNLLDAHEFLMDRQLRLGGSGQEFYHYVDAPGESTAALVAMIYSALNRNARPMRLPLPIAAPLAMIGDALAKITGIDLPITSARVRKFCTPTNFSAARIRALGFQQRTANEAAILRTVAWYLESQSARVAAKAATD